MFRRAWLLAACLLGAAALPAQRPFDVEALQRLVRISDPALSPDGTQVAFVAERILVNDNETESHVWVVSTQGDEPRQLTFDGLVNGSPAWTPDSERVVYISDRSGSEQVWMIAAGGGAPRQLTGIATGASSPRVTPDGGSLVYRSRVFPECGADDACNARRIEEVERNPVKARIYDELLYRHWDEWDDGRRGALFVRSIDGEGETRLLTPPDWDVPPFSLDGGAGFDVSPDGRQVCFVAKPVEDPEQSTNTDLFAVSIEGGEPARLTDNPAADADPVYSPDGGLIAYRAQARPGYESDRWRLQIHDRSTGEGWMLGAGLDRWVTGVSWSPDSTRLFFTAEDQGRTPIFTSRVDGGPVSTAVFGDATHGDVQVLPDGGSVIYTAHSGSHPVDIYRGFAAGGTPQQLTRFNDALLEEYSVSAYEEMTWAAPDGTELSGFIVRPPGAGLIDRHPLLVLIHGGPQGAWDEAWSYRWNAQVFAGAGYVVFLPNPRGSTGYGQALTDAIRADWGGQVYEDLMAGVDAAAARPDTDPARVVAAGGSYGGYMVNWILGHSDRFEALVSHAGVYDLESFFGATEELWFPLWEFMGAPWQSEEIYRKWSPSRFVQRFQTPTLVVHGQKDYRVPVTQGMQLFTALQMQNVPSQFLYYPDEGHWIQKPQNSVLWYRTVIGWLDRWAKAPAEGEPTSQ